VLEELREQVLKANLGLKENRLVKGTSGNASEIDSRTGYVVIKPSGVDYDKMCAADLVAMDLNGKVIEGALKPSVDWPHHLFLYKNLAGIGGVIHTHSTYATAFAASGLSIPVHSTTHADVFGEEVRCAPYADNKGDNIGKSILASKNSCNAILLEKHGVFTWGKNASEALHYAIKVEEVAKISFLAMRLSHLAGARLEAMPSHEVEKWHARYTTAYGQKKPTP
jgi:L-ribulose-5-phosphate 4-epimerase